MIDRERFEQLAALSAANEASLEERAELASMVAAQPDLAAEIAEVESTARILRRARVFVDLEQTRSDALSARRTQEAAAAPARHRHSLPSWLAMAAAVAVLAGLAGFYFRPPAHSSKDIAILSPRGETGFTQPAIAWDAAPDQRYDVWILPAQGNHLEVPALFVANGVRPPVALAALKPGPALKGQPNPPQSLEAGTDYRVLVCFADAGRIAGIAVPFRTSVRPEKSLPAPNLDTARTLAAAGRDSDALALLLQLPPGDRLLPGVQTFERDLRSRLLKPQKP